MIYETGLPAGMSEIEARTRASHLNANSMYGAMAGMHGRTKLTAKRFNEFNAIDKMDRDDYIQIVEAIMEASLATPSGRVYIFNIASAPRSLCIRSSPLCTLESLYGVNIYEFNLPTWDLLGNTKFTKSIMMGHMEVRISIDDLAVKSTLLQYRLQGNPFISIDGERYPMFISPMKIELHVPPAMVASWDIDNLYRTVNNGQGIHYERV